MTDELHPQRLRSYDDLCESVVRASGLVAKGQLDLALDIRDGLADAGELLPLAVVLLRRGYLTLSQANYLLRDSEDRLLYCDACRSFSLTPVAGLTVDGVQCSTCDMDLSASPEDVLLRAPAAVAPPPDLAATLGAGLAAAADESDQGDALIGQVVDGYAVQEKVKEGRYAGWYRASDAVMEKELMLRAIPRQFRRSKDLFMGLREDIHRSKLVNSHCKPDNFDLVQIGNNFYITQTPAEGRSINEVVETDGAIPVEEVIKIMIPVAEMVVSGHRQDLIDFDLRPDLIVVDSYGRVKVMDVSTGFLHNETVDQLRWRAPERIAHKPVNEPADVFSFSAILYYMVTGKVPFPGDDMMEVGEAILKGSVVPVQEARPATEPAMVDLIQQGMAVTPSARPSDFKAVLDLLRHIPEIMRKRQAELGKPGSQRQTKVISRADIELADAAKRNTGRITVASLRDRLTGTKVRPGPGAQVPGTPGAAPAPAKADEPQGATGGEAAAEAAVEVSGPQKEAQDSRQQILEYGKRAREFMKLKRYTLAIKALNRIVEFEGKSPDFGDEVANARKAIKMLEQMGKQSS